MGCPKCLLLLLGLTLPFAGPTQAREEKPPAILPHRSLEITPSRPRPAKHYRRLEALVRRLADLDRWQSCGLTPSSGGGMGFDPGDAGADPAACTPDDAFAALAALGPDALPVLLTHLDDETPTKLSLEARLGFGGLCVGREIGWSRARTEELDAIRSAFPAGWPGDPDLRDVRFDTGGPPIPPGSTYHFTIGDCCFALIGQITNRVYEAVRYQPTAIVVVNSPTRDPRIARAVRAQWRGRDPRRELARRLTEDLHTAKFGDSWSWLGYRQAAAAARLARYYPEESAAHLVAVVDSIEREGAAGDERPTVDEADLLYGLEGARSAALRGAVFRLALRTESMRTLEAAVSTIAPPADDALCPRVLHFLRREGDVNHWRDLAFLQAIHRLWPANLPPVLVAMLERSRDHARVVAEFVYEAKVLAPVDAWKEWLGETVKAVPWVSSGHKPLERLRLCDVAALQIAAQRKDLAFDEEADRDRRTQQIWRMCRALRVEAPK